MSIVIIQYKSTLTLFKNKFPAAKEVTGSITQVSLLIGSFIHLIEKRNKGVLWELRLSSFRLFVLF